MRLLTFAITYRPFIGGAEIALEEITKRLQGVEATVITAKFDATLPEKEQHGVTTIYRVGNGKKLDKYLFIPRALKLATRLHTTEPYHVVHALMANYAGITAYLFKRRFPKVPYVLTLQSGDSSWFIWARTFWFYPLYRNVYAKADYVQAISTYLMHRAKRYGFKGKGAVIPNGVDVGHFAHQKSKEEIAALKIELGIKQNEKVVITTSRLVYKNAVDQLILGFNEWVVKTGQPAKLVIIGTGKEEKKLKKLAEKIGVVNNVVFLGNKPNNALPLYLQASDYFVRASRSEGMGISFIEALASGVPVIASNVGGIPDFIVHEKTGMLVDRDNPFAIARMLYELDTKPELVQSIKDNGRALVHSKYEWDIIAQKMQEVFEMVCKKSEL